MCDMMLSDKLHTEISGRKIWGENIIFLQNFWWLFQLDINNENPRNSLTTVDICYISRNSQRVPTDVTDALLGIFMKERKMDRPKAEEFHKKLESTRHLQSETWSWFEEVLDHVIWLHLCKTVTMRRWHWWKILTTIHHAPT